MSSTHSMSNRLPAAAIAPYRYAVLAAVALCAASMLSTSSHAEDVVLTWTVPTHDVNNVPIPATGPGALASYAIAYGLCDNGQVPAASQTQVISAPATTATIAGRTAGTWCFKIMAQNVAGEAGQWSNPVNKVVASPVTVGFWSGVTQIPVFGLTATGTRSSTVLGVIPIGKPCIGDQLGTYRGQGYRRVARADVFWWGTATDNAVAMCK